MRLNKFKINSFSEFNTSLNLLFLWMLILLFGLNFQSFAGTNIVSLRITNSDNGYYDETVVRTMPGATALFDGCCDARKLISPNLNVPSFYSKDSDGNLYSINSMFELTRDTSIALYFKSNLGGTFYLQTLFNPLFDDSVTVFLHDNKTGVYHNMMENSLVYMNITNTGIEYQRFTLVLSKAPTFEYHDLSYFGSNDGSIALFQPGNLNFSFAILKEDGSVYESFENCRETYSYNNLSPGNYQIKFKNYDKIIIWNFSIAEPEL